MILRAARFAAIAHEGQKRKYSGLPYIIHPARVAGRVAILPGATEVMVAAAFLHDVVEDTVRTIESIESEFGKDVANLVNGLTSYSIRTGSTANRAARKNLDVNALRIAPIEVKRIKLIDRIDNLNDLVGADAGFMKLYAEESKHLNDAIGDADEELSLELDTARRKALTL